MVGIPWGVGVGQHVTRPAAPLCAPLQHDEPAPLVPAREQCAQHLGRTRRPRFPPEQRSWSPH